MMEELYLVEGFNAADQRVEIADASVHIFGSLDGSSARARITAIKSKIIELKSKSNI